MKSWFSVGDEVIVQGCGYDEFNGVEGVIHKILRPNLLHFCRITGKWCKNIESEEVYLLDFPCKNPHNEMEISFRRTSLKRRYQPSTDSFDVMIRKLKSGEKI